MQPRLTRSRADRMIGGVCGGLGHYFGVDPVIVRLIFVVLAITTFLTPLIYPVLWLIMPEDRPAQPGLDVSLPPDARFDPMTGQPLHSTPTYTTPTEAPAPRMPSAHARNRTLGFLLAGIGALFLFDRVSSALSSLFNIHVGNFMIPLLLIGAGIYLLRSKQMV